MQRSVQLRSFHCFCPIEIYRIVSQRQIQDPIGAQGNGGAGSTHVPIRLPPTNPVSDSKQTHLMLFLDSIHWTAWLINRSFSIHFKRYYHSVFFFFFISLSLFHFGNRSLFLLFSFDCHTLESPLFFNNMIYFGRFLINSSKTHHHNNNCPSDVQQESMSYAWCHLFSLSLLIWLWIFVGMADFSLALTPPRTFSFSKFCHKLVFYCKHKTQLKKENHLSTRTAVCPIYSKSLCDLNFDIEEPTQFLMYSLTRPSAVLCQDQPMTVGELSHPKQLAIDRDDELISFDN